MTTRGARRATRTRCPGCEQTATQGAPGVVMQDTWEKRTSYGSSGLATYSRDVKAQRPWHATCLDEVNREVDQYKRDTAVQQVHDVITIARAAGLDADAVIRARRAVGNDTLTDDEIRVMWAEATA